VCGGTAAGASFPLQNRSEAKAQEFIKVPTINRPLPQAVLTTPFISYCAHAKHMLRLTYSLY